MWKKKKSKGNSPDLKPSSSEAADTSRACPSEPCPIPKRASPQTYNLTKLEMKKFERKIENMLRCFVGETTRSIPKYYYEGTRLAENCSRGMKKRNHLLAAAVRAYNQEKWLEPWAINYFVMNLGELLVLNLENVDQEEKRE